MPNVTITIPTETYRRARVWAAENYTTVTDTVRDILKGMPHFSAEKMRQVRCDNLREAKHAKLAVKIAGFMPSGDRIAG